MIFVDSNDDINSIYEICVKYPAIPTFYKKSQSF